MDHEEPETDEPPMGFVCPHCRQPTEAFKQFRYMQFFIFYLAGAFYQEEILQGCGPCLRRKLWKRCLISLPLANLLWPVLLLPWAIAIHIRSKRPGNSPEVVAVYRRIVQEAQFNASPMAMQSGFADTAMISRNDSTTNQEVNWGRTFTIVAILFCVFPLVGLLFALMGYLGSRKTPSWYRTTSLVLTIFGAILTFGLMAFIVAKSL